MIIYLSGTSWCSPIVKHSDLLTKETAANINILSSFAYIKAEKTLQSFIPYFQNFMLDSGAFTFLNKKTKVNWNDYVAKYCDFINAFDIKYFIEIDVYKILGYEQVMRIRQEIERRTGKRCIPVWHRYLGQEEFISMCRNCDYVALGGIALKEISPKEHKFFPWFINTAHSYGAMIHGLGYTVLAGLHKYHFDSVDSSSWMQNSTKFGGVYKFTGKNMKVYNRPSNGRIKTSKLMVHNFKQWIDFSIFAKDNL